MGESAVAGQWAGEGKIWGPRKSRETVDLVITLDANPGLSNRRRRGLECGYGNTPRGVDEVEIGSVKKGDRVWATISTENATTLSAVLMVDRN